MSIKNNINMQNILIKGILLLQDYSALDVHDLCQYINS